MYLRVLLTLSFFFISGLATASAQCPSAISLVFTEENGQLQATYHLPSNNTQLKLQATQVLREAMLPVTPADYATTNDQQLTLRSGNNANTIKIAVRSLIKFINATAAPYVKAGHRHGIHLPSFLPLAMKQGNEDWQPIAARCVQLSYRKTQPLHTKLTKELFIDGSLSFILLDFSQTKRAVVSQAIEIIRNNDFPSWLADLIARYFTEFYQFYLKHLNVTDKYTLTVILAYEQSEQPFYQGDVHNFVATPDKTGHVFVLRYGGSAWLTYNPGPLNEIAEFIAHEVFHLFTPIDEKTLWLHEGAAETASLYALKQLKVLSETEVQIIHQQRVLSCLLQFANRPIPNDPGWMGRYSCGYTLLSNLFDPESFFKTWGAMLKNKPDDQRFFLSQFLAASNKQALATVHNRKASTTELESSYAMIVAPIMLSTKLNDERLLNHIFRHLMATNCHGVVSFNTKEHLVEMYDQPAYCPEPFRQLSGYYHTMNGLSLRENSALLFQNYLTNCADKKRIDLIGKNNAVTLPCNVSSFLLQLIQVR